MTFRGSVGWRAWLGHCLALLAAFAIIMVCRRHRPKPDQVLVPTGRPLEPIETRQNQNGKTAMVFHPGLFFDANDKTTGYITAGFSGVHPTSPSEQSYTSPATASDGKLKVLSYNGPTSRWPTSSPRLLPLRYGESTTSSLPALSVAESTVSETDANLTQAQINELRRRIDDLTSPAPPAYNDA
ncbi:hypothetical protein J3R30DRAFT_3410290 [Lentinula aciculospora]|uniref:Transmembrane protein n=1 Tax=Lentinula aciculospora TaxID=153920 RepID=A0A9W8ZXS1_9AGAR|nr:hypothetical protein J3R30DRAFT_3410290 [Lentinula aciculospora]